MFFVLFSFFFSFCVGCSSDAECGSGDYLQPGLCVSGVCQCGFGFSGNRPVDPLSCALACSPPALTDSVAFLIEPNVTVAANAGKLQLDVDMLPFLKQTPANISFLHPVSGVACRLMPEALGQVKKKRKKKKKSTVRLFLFF